MPITSIIAQQQFNFNFFQTQRVNVGPALPFIIGGGVIVLALVVIAIVRNARKSPAALSGPGAFRRQARRLGLEARHIKLLEQVFHEQGVKDAAAALFSPRQLDAVFTKAIQKLQDESVSDAYRQSFQLNIIQIRTQLENLPPRHNRLTSTVGLRSGQAMTVSVREGERFQTQVIANLSDFMAVSVPRGPQDNIVQWNKNTPVTCFFVNQHHEGYSFPTRVLGYKVVKEAQTLMLAHSQHLSFVQQRRFRRRAIERPCYLTPVTIVEEGRGRNKKKRIVPGTEKKTLGHLADISAGGCSIHTGRSFERGKYVRIDFETVNRQSLGVYGRIKSCGPSEAGRGMILHVQFAKLSGKSFVDIQSYVYGYTE